MTTPSIARLGHVGLHVQDLEKGKAFFRDIVGLTVTDEDPELGMVFMSARPEEEHHEFLLCRGRNVGTDAKVVQQISFRCNSLGDVIGFYRRFKEHGIRIDRTVSHGNALSVYFYDPAPLYDKLAQLPVDVLGLDFTYNPKLVHIVAAAGAPVALQLGIVDGRNTKLEDPAAVARQIERMAPKLGQRTYLAPSCGLEYLPRDRAYAKLELLEKIRQAVAA